MAAKRGRPRAKVDLEIVRELARDGNTINDICDADEVHIARSTFMARKDIMAAYRAGLADLRTSLRHWQVNEAKNGNVQMLVWLGKNLLGQSEKTEAQAQSETDDDKLSQGLEALAAEMEAERVKK